MDKTNKKLNSMLSLCMRAGKLQNGEETCEVSVKNKTSKLIILSMEASANTTKKFTDKTKFYAIPLITLQYTKDELGHLIGKSERAVLSVIDYGFAKQILKLFNSKEEC